MKTKTFTTGVVLLAAVSGCATYSSNMRVGNDMSYASLGDQRTAAQSISVLDSVPTGAVIIGPVDAGRCHRSFVETSPAQEMVVLDLKLAAYARGADAIVGVTVTKRSALTKNCWYALTGKATAVRIPKP